MILRLASALSAIGVIGWSVYQYDQSHELDTRLEQAEQLHAGCVANRKRSGQSDYGCREWSYAQVAGSGSPKTQKRLSELATAAAVQSAKECRRELETRSEQLRLLEAELRGSDGALVFRTNLDATRHAELSNRIAAIGPDCQAGGDPFQRYANIRA